MEKTIALVTGQQNSEQIIGAARGIADRDDTELSVVGVLDQEYILDAETVNYLFELAKKSGAVLRMVFAHQKAAAMRAILQEQEVKTVLTGLPGGNSTIIYSLWQMFPCIDFMVVGNQGDMVTVNPRMPYCPA